MFPLCRLVRVLPVTCLLALPAFAHNPIQWMSDPQEAVEVARNEHRPLLVWVPPNSDDYSSELDQLQRDSFRNDQVNAVVAARYVPLRLTRSNQHMQWMAQLGAPGNYGMYLAVITPHGKLIGVIEPTQTVDTPKFVQALISYFNQYRTQLYNDDIAPILSAPGEGDVPKLGPALRTIREFDIGAADTALIQLLNRPRLPQERKHEILMTLADLSTGAALKYLVTSAGSDRFAAEALEHITPAGAAILAQHLVSDDSDLNWLLYETICRVDRIQPRKIREFWKNRPADEKQMEIDRIRRIADQTARRWELAGGHLPDSRSSE